MKLFVNVPIRVLNSSKEEHSPTSPGSVWVFSYSQDNIFYPLYDFYLLLFVFLLWEELDSVFSITMQQVMENRNDVSPQAFPPKTKQTHPSPSCLHAVSSSPPSRLLATAELTLICPWFSFTEDPQTRCSNPDVVSQMPNGGEGSLHRPASYNFPVCGWASWAKDPYCWLLFNFLSQGEYRQVDITCKCIY